MAARIENRLHWVRDVSFDEDPQLLGIDPMMTFSNAITTRGGLCYYEQGSPLLSPRLVTAPDGPQTEIELHPSGWAAQNWGFRRAPGPSLARYRRTGSL